MTTHQEERQSQRPVRMTASMWELVTWEAQREGVSIAEWIRQAVWMRLERRK